MRDWLLTLRQDKKKACYLGKAEYLRTFNKRERRQYKLGRRALPKTLGEMQAQRREEAEIKTVKEHEMIMEWVNRVPIERNVHMKNHMTGGFLNRELGEIDHDVRSSFFAREVQYHGCTRMLPFCQWNMKKSNAILVNVESAYPNMQVYSGMLSSAPGLRTGGWEHTC